MLLFVGTPGLCHGSFGFEGKGFCVVTVSRPGYGRTPMKSGETVAEQAELCDVLMTEELKADKYVIMGKSGAGPVALQMAI